MKTFNTAGPVNQEIYYKIDPLTRLDLEEILLLIEQRKYFILHAPRQTGKTSCLLALREYLNERKDYYCVYANFESAQVARNDVNQGMRYILSELHQRVELVVPREIADEIKPSPKEREENSLNLYLNRLCRMLDKPLILLIDEIDSLIGDTLISVLRQLRSGYDSRPSSFPQSSILCGVRDIKDYRIHRSDNDVITGGSCFNIKAVSLSLGNFSLEEVVELYAEHTRETGQVFESDCFPLIMRYTAGQSWLVNALGHEVTFEMRENRNRSIPITAEMMEKAKERIIIARSTHIDQLADKLKEDRVRRVIEPLLTGEVDRSQEDDNQYCLDLGLVRKSENGLIIANEIYKEVIPRELTDIQQTRFKNRLERESLHRKCRL